jgi:D-alanine--poly(phosphoribitol) ligase subunit 1
MWQNKIQILWSSIQKAVPTDAVFEKMDTKSAKMTKVTYADFQRDLSLMQSEFANLTNLKIMVLMEKSYASFLTIVFCLLKGHCFIPVFAKSKRVHDLIAQTQPTHILVNESASSFKGLQTINVNEILKNSVSEKSAFVPASQLPESCAYIITTSGTTGIPKLIPISYFNFSSYIENILQVVSSREPIRLLQNFEITFDPYLMDLVVTLSNRSSLLSVDHADLRHLDAILSHSPNKETWISLTPSQADLIVSVLSKKTWSYVKKTFFLGEKLKRNLCLQWLSFFPGTEIFNMYGPAETTVSIFHHKFNPKKDTLDFIPIGQVHPNHAIAISNQGELTIKGPQVFKGYMDLKNTSGDEFFNTHDLVDVINSEIFVKGRSDLQIKINGRRFEPEEMESVLNEKKISGYVVPVFSEQSTKIKTYVVFVTTNSNLDLQQLNAHLQLKFDPDFFPKKILFQTTYPLSQNGKIDRKKLVEIANQIDGKF